jgi:RecA/RadA recombinase
MEIGWIPTMDKQMNTSKNKLEAFFKSFSDTEDKLDFRIANETADEKYEVISTGSLVLNDALACGGLPKGRILQYYGAAGCHAKGQGILMADGSTKAVEDIQVGDQLMGPTGFRKVLRLLRGQDKMYRIVPVKGAPFIVNENHILTLVRHHRTLPFELVDVSLKDWLGWSDYQKKIHKLIRSGVDRFAHSKAPNQLPIDPYILGLLLGDGSLQTGIAITTADQEILTAFANFANKANLRLSVKSKPNNMSSSYGAVGERFITNDTFSLIKKLGINVRCEKKFIPQMYKSASKQVRLEVLAGLLDSDGHYTRGGFDFISKSQTLSNDFAFLARSVGLAAYVTECKKSAYKGHSDTYFRVSVSGDCSVIPNKVSRKQAHPRKQIKNVLHTGFEAEYVGRDNYFGFTLTNDGRYLLDDFTITHNSGKSLMAMLAIKEAQITEPETQQVWIDAEQTFDAAWAKSLGLDLNRIIVIDEDTAANGRKCFEMLLGVPKEDQKHILKGKSKEGLFDKIINKEFNINLIVLDSLGSIQPPMEDTSVVGKSNMALMARFLSTTLKKVSLEVKKANVVFIIINHKRDNMDPYGQDHTFAGGNSYSHFLSANLYFEAVQRKDAMILDEKENKVGHPLRATIEKNKMGPWPRKCEFKVHFGKGVIDQHEEIAQLALDYDIISKPSTMSYEYGDKKWVGAAKFQEAIRSDKTFADELVQKITDARELKKKGVAENLLAPPEKIVEKSEKVKKSQV